jgi:hypothetical protein
MMAIMTEEDFRRLFPRGSKSFAAANPHLIGGSQPEKPVAGRTRAARGKCMNLTESKFRLLLQERFPDCQIRFEAYKLRIGERCYYCPDFAVIHLSGLIDFYECKGAHIWEDSLIKCKAAKEMYPHHIFEMWQHRKGNWTQIL